MANSESPAPVATGNGAFKNDRRRDAINSIDKPADEFRASGVVQRHGSRTSGPRRSRRPLSVHVADRVA
jgi:hypothetical protein